MMTVKRSHYKDGKRVYFPRGTIIDDNFQRDRDYEVAQVTSLPINTFSTLYTVERLMEEADGAYTYHKFRGESRSAAKAKEFYRMKARIVKDQLLTIRESLKRQLDSVNEGIDMLSRPIKFKQLY